MVIALGWRYHYLGLMVPVVMTIAAVGGLFRGRYVCGNLCPRGSFLETWMARLSAGKNVPIWMRSAWFRAVVMTFLMGFLAWRLSLDIGSLDHWGYVFWQMCLLTNIAAVALVITFRERAWCMICPMGTLQALEGRGKYQLQISDACIGCGLCDRVCPMNLPVSVFGAPVR